MKYRTKAVDLRLLLSGVFLIRCCSTNLVKISFKFAITKGDFHAYKKPNQTCDCLQIIRFFNLIIVFPSLFSDWNVNHRSRKNAYQSYSIHMTALRNTQPAVLSVKSLPKFRESRCFFCQADSNNNQAGFHAVLKNCLPNDWPSAYCPENKYPHRKLWRYLWQKSEPHSYNAIWQYIVPLDVASNTKEDWK